MRTRTFCITLALLAGTIFNLSAQSTMSNEYRLPSLYQGNDDGFIVIAHRGASAYYPENTMAAFKAALEMDAEMIELDVMMTGDGVPVAFHDALLDDHTNGSGFIWDYSLEELRKLDAGSWFDERFAGQKIPTLEEVIAFAAGKIALNIEIKTEAVTDRVEGGVEQKSLQLVRKYGMEDHVLFSSFDYRAVARLKKLDPEIPVALLYNKRKSDSKLPHQLVQQLNADAFNCSFRQLRRKWVKNLKEYEIPHFIYTVNSKRKMKSLYRSGVTGIFTDKPDLLNEVVKKLGK